MFGFDRQGSWALIPRSIRSSLHTKGQIRLPCKHGSDYLGDGQGSMLIENSTSELSDIDIEKENLDSTLFPGVSSSVEVHSGFANEQTR